MAYEFFVPTTPNGGQRLEEFAASFRENTTALRDAILYGLLPSSTFTYSQAGNAREPTAITVLSGNERLFLDLTWANNNISTIVTKYSPTSSGGTTDTAATMTASYDTAGELTAVSGGAMGLFGKFIPLLGKIAKLSDDYIAHTAASTGAAAHGMGTFAAQNITAITVTGGTAIGVTIGSDGSTAMGTINCNNVAEGTQLLGTYSGGQTILADIGSAGWIEFSITGSSVGSPAVFATTNEPKTAYARGQIFYVVIYVPNGAGTQYITWNGYNFLTINTTQLDQNKTHVFIGTVRSNGSTLLKIMEYLGVLV